MSALVEMLHSLAGQLCHTLHNGPVKQPGANTRCTGRSQTGPGHAKKSLRTADPPPAKQAATLGQLKCLPLCTAPAEGVLAVTALRVLL